ncbi:MAG: oxidoreductase [Candidatus Solibacter usitatus]|nr:oxidoreductase [Candidatus Solibacter usitatus]
MIGPDIRHLYYEIPDMQEFPFTVGQFVSLSEMVNGKKVTRAYSIASRPKKNTFELCINLVHDGVFTPHLFSMKPGDGIEMKGPHGMFVMKKPVRDTIYVATGTGIAPFLPMLQESLEQYTEQKFTLVFGVRYEDTLLYDDIFKQMAADHSNFKYIGTVTRPTPAWKGNGGRVQQYLFPEVGERKDFDIYICGLKEMVNDVRDKLLALGFDKKQVNFERYD